MSMSGDDAYVLAMDYVDETLKGGGALKGDDGKSAYQSWLELGNTGTEEDFINSLKGEKGQVGEKGETGNNGKSAYDLWLEAGNVGSEQDFLDSLKGDPGEKGDNGKSAYQYAQDGGYIGTETEFTTNIARSGVISKELEVERVRIDNLTTLKDGSTTGDAELIDARIDKDGNTHVNVGKHIRTVTSQLSSENAELKQDLSTLYNETGVNLLTQANWVIGKYYDCGTERENENWCHTGKIEVNGGSTLVGLCSDTVFYSFFSASVCTGGGTVTPSNGEFNLQAPANCNSVILSFEKSVYLNSVVLSKNFYGNSMKALNCFGSVITDNSILQSLDNAEDFTLYNLQIVSNDNVPNNMPNGYVLYDDYFVLTLPSYTGNYFRTQWFMDCDFNVIAKRFSKNGTWEGYSYIQSDDSIHHVITVSSDGTKDFTTLSEAISSTSGGNVNNVYDIYLYEGTYDIVTEVFGDGEYTNNVGIVLPDYVNIIGIGNRENIVLVGRLDVDKLSGTTAPSYFSTLNLKYTNTLENITVIAKNCRYAVHDESDGNYKNYKRVVKNCVFIHEGMEDSSISWKYPDAYGHGMSSGSDSYFENCEFILQDTTFANGTEPNAGYICHNNSNFDLPCVATFKYCLFKNTGASTCFRSGTYGDKKTDNVLTLEGCTFEGNGTSETIVMREEVANSGTGIGYYLNGMCNKKASVKIIDSTSSGWEDNLIGTIN